MDVITVISAGKALNGPSLVAIDHVLGVDLLWCLCVDHALGSSKRRSTDTETDGQWAAAKRQDLVSFSDRFMFCSKFIRLWIRSAASTVELLVCKDLAIHGRALTSHR